MKGGIIPKMKKVIYFVLIIMFMQVNLAFAASNLEEGVKQLAEQISKNMQEKQSKKIAIIDFSDLNGNVTALGQFMAEELTTQLFIIAPGKFEVVERRQLLKLEEELVLGQVGIIEEKGIKKMGQVLGVDAIVTGSMTDLGNTVKINARLMAVETAKIFAVAATDIPKTGIVADLLARPIAPRQPIVSSAGHGSVSTPAVSSTISSIEPPKSGTPFQEFKELRVEVESLQVTKANAVVMFLKYINKTQKELNVGLKSGSWSLSDYPTYLTDDKGNEYRLNEMGGIGGVGKYPHKDPLKILPGISSTPSIKFRGDSNWQVGSTFHFTSEQGIVATDDSGNLKIDKDNRDVIGSVFNISIRNIKPTK